MTPGDAIDAGAIEHAIAAGEAAFAARQPDCACPFRADAMRAAWLTGWKFACLSSERDALQREVRTMQDTLREMTARLDAMEQRS